MSLANRIQHRSWLYPNAVSNDDFANGNKSLSGRRSIDAYFVGDCITNQVGIGSNP